MNIMDMLAGLLNPQQPQNRLAGAGQVAAGRFDDPGAMSDPGVQAILAGQRGTQQPAQAFSPPMAPQSAPMPQAAPAPAQGGGIGGMLGNLFNPGAGQKNQTIGWLTQQGLDEGTATLLAGNKPALQQYLLARSKGKEYDFITGRDGSIFRADKSSGNLDQVYGGKPDRPTEVQEYEYAKGQGYQGTFQEFQIEQKRAGASQVNIDQKAEGAFDKKLAENQATMFTEMATGGMDAKADLGVLGELEGLLGQTGGTFSGVSGVLAKYGIGGEGMGDLQAAQALINKLVPTQRQPGSGTMSDRDVELFTRSLPNLFNTPGGNQKILSVMRGLAQYKQAQGDIASAVLSGTMSRQEATAALKALPNPLAEFKGVSGPAITDQPTGSRTIKSIKDLSDAELEAIINGE